MNSSNKELLKARLEELQKQRAALEPELSKQKKISNDLKAKSMIEQIKGYSTYPRDVAAGLLGGAKGTLESAAMGVGAITPGQPMPTKDTTLAQLLGYQPGLKTTTRTAPTPEEQIEKNPLHQFDPYKMLGIKEEHVFPALHEKGAPLFSSHGAAQLIGELLPAFPGAKHGVGKAKEFLTSSPEKANTYLQLSHDLIDNEATKLFNEVEREAINRGMNTIAINPKQIKKLKKYFPDTLATKNLFKEAMKGDYQALRDLQSDLWKRGKKKLASDSTAENNLGEEMIDKRRIINNDIATQFRLFGHDDLADKLRKGMDLYHHVRKTFYGKNVPSAIKKLVNEETREIPKNIFNVLSKQSKQMNRIKAESPLAEKEYIKHERNKKIGKYISPLGKISDKVLKYGPAAAAIMYLLNK